jgi:hypothetical protein
MLSNLTFKNISLIIFLTGSRKISHILGAGGLVMGIFDWSMAKKIAPSNSAAHTNFLVMGQSKMLITRPSLPKIEAPCLPFGPPFISTCKGKGA